MMEASLKIGLIELNLETGDVRLVLKKTVGAFDLGNHSLAVDALDDLEARLGEVETHLAKEGFAGVDRGKLSKALSVRNLILDDDGVRAFNAARSAERVPSPPNRKV
jgi:hypothetical protein